MVYEIEDEREIDEIEPAEPMGHATVTFNVPMPTIEQVTGAIARQLVASSGYDKRAEYSALVRTKIDDLIDQMIEEKARPVLADLLSKALQPTDGFGKPVGSPISLESLIAENITIWASQKVDPYGAPIKEIGWSDKGKPRIEFMLGQIVQNDLAAAVGAETKRISEQLKGAATAAIAKQIAERVAGMVLK